MPSERDCTGSSDRVLTPQERQAEYSRIMALLAQEFLGNDPIDEEKPSRCTAPDVEGFDRIVVCVARIVFAQRIDEGRSALRLALDFGPPLGVRHSLLERADRYTRAELVGLLVVAATNLPEQVDDEFRWDSIPLFLPDATGAVTLVQPDQEVPIGTRLFGIR